MAVRIGDFELDARGCRLTRNGREIHLAKQSFDLLILLVSRPGEVVTREEIHQALWGATFVDSEHGINSTIRRIRAALRDDAASPKYIETLVGRGYRFKAPVLNQ
jgi:DNA-binding winged helix-turn-helix (wHTH) protein